MSSPSTSQLICYRTANDARIVDGAAHHFLKGLFDHELLAAFTANDGVGSGLDISYFLSIEDELLAVESSYKDHGENLKNGPRDSRINTCREGSKSIRGIAAPFLPGRVQQVSQKLITGANHTARGGKTGRRDDQIDKLL